MKSVKGIVLGVAILAMSLSITPLFAGNPKKQPTVDGGSGGGTAWNVTCNYDGNHVLLSKTCTSGGAFSCSCS